MNNSKFCRHCKIEKALNLYPDLPLATDGKNVYCTSCFLMLQEYEQEFVTGAGWVYAITGADLVKLGVAINPDKRLRELQIGSPVPLRLVASMYVPNPYEVESKLHAVHAKYRRHGEWFEYAPIKASILNDFS